MNDHRMQRLLASVCALLLVAACAAAPSGPPAVEKGELTDAPDGTRIAIKRGGELKVVLDANPTIRLPWEADANVGPVLSPIGQRIYVGKTMNSFDIAGGGWNIFRYRAEQAGTITLHFATRRLGDPAVARKVDYEVVVE